MRIFLAHAKGAAEDAHVGYLAAEIASRFPGASVVLSRDAHRETFADGGGWLSWAHMVGSGHDWQGQPTYDGYVILTDLVGRVTAHIVAAALSANRGVIYWPRGASAPAPVRAVEAVPGSESWTHGWRIIT